NPLRRNATGAPLPTRRGQGRRAAASGARSYGSAGDKVEGSGYLRRQHVCQVSQPVADPADRVGHHRVNAVRRLTRALLDTRHCRVELGDDLVAATSDKGKPYGT